MKLLAGKTALITGASRGIGKAIAIKFASEGANIAFSDLNHDENMSQTEQELLAMGVNAKGYASNAASYEDSENLINQVVEEFGTIDILVNNAGITRDNLLMRMQEKDWDMVLTVNLKSAFNLTKAVQRVMMKQRSGSIINMSSVVGVSGNAGQSNYAASKAGMIGFTKSIAQELGSRNIRCNAIAPGFIETEMTHKLADEVREEWIKSIPLKRSGKPEDVANTAVYLASDLSSYVSGQVINVCGGMNT
jgi:3-oxoacyl-[acyl-carrier protein] reductase